MPRIIIYGGRGWIGQQILELLNNVGIECLVSELRVNNFCDLMTELEHYQPTHVICCIGRTSGKIDNDFIGTIDYLEYPGKLVDNISDNLYAPLLLARATHQLGIHMTYMGTGCIFDYIIENPNYRFTENDYPNFFGSSYSIVKGYTDIIMKDYDNILNVRIRMPISYKQNPKEFITKIINYQNICSIPNSMTVLDDLLPIMLDMSLKNEVGTINLVNPGVITHNEILEMYKNNINPSHTWNNITYEQQMTFLRSHRSNNQLDTTKLQSKYPQVQDIKTSIANVLSKRYNKFIHY